MSRYAAVHAPRSARALVDDARSSTEVGREFALAELAAIPGAKVSVVLPPEVVASFANHAAMLALLDEPEALIEVVRRLGYVTRLIVPFPGRVTIFLVDEANARITDEAGQDIVLAVV